MRRNKKNKMYNFELSQLKERLVSEEAEGGEQTPAVKYEHKTIDFEDMLKKHRQRTEVTFPFTIHQIEDVMFVDETRLAAFEVILYSKEEDYRRIKNDGNQQIHYLGTDDYLKNLNQQSSFQDKPVNFKVSEKNYIDEHKPQVEDPKKKDKKKSGMPNFAGNLGNMLKGEIKDAVKNANEQLYFHNTTNKDDCVVEYMISVWTTSSEGNLQKEKEISFNFKGQDYEEGKMKLFLSHDRKIMILYKINQTNGLSVLTWDVKTLKKIDMPKKLTNNLKNIKEQPLEIKFVGKNKYLYVSTVITHNKSKHKNFYIFSVATGEQLFTFRNSRGRVDSTIQTEITEESVFIMDMLICEKKRRYKHKATEQCMDEHLQDYGSEDSEFADEGQEVVEEEEEEKNEDSEELEEI